MEFLTQNHINTTTQISLTNNTASSSYVFSRDPLFSYVTDGVGTDATTASVTITFDATTPVSRIALVNTNLKSFTIFYNGATANTFVLTGDTTASNYTGNSSSSIYLRCATTMVSSVTIDMKTTQEADMEKVLGLFLLSDLHVSLDKIPNAKGYKPVLKPKQIVHQMADGGTRIHNIRKKMSLDIKLDYVSEAQTSSLRDIFDLNAPFYFVPFGTSTGWDGICFESVWQGDFNFHEFSDNAAASGFSGMIRLRETPA